VHIRSSAGVIAAALISSVASISALLLLTQSDHDLARSAAMLGLVLSGMAVGYFLLSQRMARTEQVLASISRTEHNVLTVLERDRIRDFN
jgi:hypothetical protein